MRRFGTGNLLRGSQFSRRFSHSPMMSRNYEVRVTTFLRMALVGGNEMSLTSRLTGCDCVAQLAANEFCNGGGNATKEEQR